MTRHAPDRLDLHQAARLLQMPLATVERWVRQGLLEHETTASGPEFSRPALEAWATRHDLPLGTVTARRTEGLADVFARALQRGAHTREDRAKTASDAIQIALAALEFDPGTRELLYEDILERERLAGTGVGQGVAVPHPRRPRGELVTEACVSALFLSEPLDWAALDGRPVHTVLLVLSPDVPRHLDLLSRAAFALRQPGFDAFLRAGPDQEALLARLGGMGRE